MLACFVLKNKLNKCIVVLKKKKSRLDWKLEQRVFFFFFLVLGGWGGGGIDKVKKIIYLFLSLVGVTTKVNERQLLLFKTKINSLTNRLVRERKKEYNN